MIAATFRFSAKADDQLLSYEGLYRTGSDLILTTLIGISRVYLGCIGQAMCWVAGLPERHGRSDSG